MYEYPEKKIVVTFGTMFINTYYGETLQIMGKDGTIDIGRHGLRVFLEPYTDKNNEILEKLARQKRELGEKFDNLRDIPVYTYRGERDLYHEGASVSHMKNFIDCVRTRARTRCNEDDGLEEAATCIMSVEALKQKRQVKRDHVRQEIV